jgi:hypothetical protein
MSDKALLFVVGYMVVAFGLGVLIGKYIRWRRTGTTQYIEED